MEQKKELHLGAAPVGGQFDNLYSSSYGGISLLS